MSPRCIKGHDCDHPIACPTCFPPPTAVSEMNRYVDAAEREAGENARLRAEVRALRRERRALRKIIREAIKLSPRLRAVFAKHLEKRQGKARRPGRTK